MHTLQGWRKTLRRKIFKNFEISEFIQITFLFFRKGFYIYWYISYLMGCMNRNETFEWSKINGVYLGNLLVLGCVSRLHEEKLSQGEITYPREFFLVKTTGTASRKCRRWSDFRKLISVLWRRLNFGLRDFSYRFRTIEKPLMTTLPYSSMLFRQNSRRDRF